MIQGKISPRGEEYRPGLARFIPTAALSPNNSAHLDAFRTLAAWAVMWGHLRGLFFLDFPEVRNPNILTKFLYAVTGFGHQAVMVFFVLSGFFISAAIFRRHIRGVWTWHDYLTDRWVRLYVVLIPGLVLGGALDILGSNLFSASRLYSHPLQNFGAISVDEALTPFNLAGSLLFLQKIICEPFGSNHPLWSLTNEFWYYILFPILVLLVLVRNRIVAMLGLGVLSISVMLLIGTERLIGFVVWLAGCALLLVYSHFSHLRASQKGPLVGATIAAGIAWMGCLIAARRATPSPLGSDLAVGLSFAAFLCGILLCDVGASRFYRKVSQRFSGFSYSLYVLHFPLLLFLRAWIIPANRWRPDLPHLLEGVLIGLIVTGYAWIIASFTELHTHSVRAWVRQCFSLAPFAR